MIIDINTRQKILSVSILGIAFLFCILNMNFYIDDGLIYGRYIENYSKGVGLVFNEGENYNALTSPFFTYLVLLVNSLFDDVLFSLNLVSAVCFLALLFGTYALLNSYGFIRAAVFASAIIAVTPFFYKLFTLETTLYSSLIIFSLIAYQKKSYYLLTTILALLVATRSEGIFLCIAILIHSGFMRSIWPD